MKPTVTQGVRDALLRRVRSANGSLNRGVLPKNRAEARRMLRGAGPHMRFRYEMEEVDGVEVRRAVRVRM